MKFLRGVGSALMRPFRLLWRWLYWLSTVQNRERLRLVAEMVQTKGLLPLLMKQRNGYRWTDEDRKKIRSQLRRLVLLSPYLILFLLPGGFFALPILAWWLDRRRQTRIGEVKQTESNNS